MSKRDEVLLLEDIIESSNKILKYTEGMNFDIFFNDEKTKDAVTRNFEIIGEASNRVSEDLKIMNQEVDWIRLRGFRNRLIHDYFGIDYSIVWEIINNDLETLISRIELIIKENS